jgi:hypothetical protein
MASNQKEDQAITNDKNATCLQMVPALSPGFLWIQPPPFSPSARQGLPKLYSFLLFLIACKYLLTFLVALPEHERRSQ